MLGMAVVFESLHSCTTRENMTQKAFSNLPGRIGGTRAGVTMWSSAGNEEPPQQKQWCLFVSRTDHYIWRDENVFVGIVADAGDWTVEVDTIRKAFATANQDGSASVFTAPLYVIKDYVRELQNYGLVAEAREALEGESSEAWSRRDWQTLSPELKESLEEQKSERSEGPVVHVYVLNSDHATFDGSKGGMAKFRAYVELAADKAGKFTPDESSLNACYRRIRGEEGKAPVLSLSPDAAENAVAQLRSSGFKAEIGS